MTPAGIAITIVGIILPIVFVISMICIGKNTERKESINNKKEEREELITNLRNVCCKFAWRYINNIEYTRDELFKDVRCICTTCNISTNGSEEYIFRIDNYNAKFIVDSRSRLVIASSSNL